MSSKVKSSAEAGSGAALVPKLRFSEFHEAGAWETAPGDELFQQVSKREAPPGLPILAITQEHGAIPRNMIDYHVSVTEKSLETYKEVRPGDFIISLRSFQGGIEFSDYHGICSPAYVVLRRRGRLCDTFYRQHFKSHDFIQQLTRNLEGLRDGKMISYKQFSELQLLKPTLPEQEKIADCLDSADALIAAQGRKVEALRAHKKGLMKQLFPQEGSTQPRLRFPEFRNAERWNYCTVGEAVESKIIFPPRDGNHGNIHPKSSDYVDAGIPFIMASDLKNGLIDFKNCHFIDKRQADKLQKGFAKEGDVLLSHKGTVGSVAIVQKIDTPYLMLTPQVTYYRVRDRERLSADFLAQLFNSGAFQANLIRASGGGTRSYIGLIEQAKLNMYFPKSIGEQQRIADSLTSLDDLIVAETRKLDMLRTHKNGLRRQLFPVIKEFES